MPLLAEAAEKVTPFDFQRMLLGGQSWLFLAEVVFRTSVIYLYVLLLLRLLGKRGAGNLTPFDSVIIIALGSACGDPMFYHDVSLLQAMVAVTVVVLLQRGMIFLIDHNDWLQTFLSSQPTRLVIDGCLELQNMRKEAFDREELFESLRQHGVEQLGVVKWAYLEPSGEISAKLLTPETARRGLMVLPPYDDFAPGALQAGGGAPAADEYVCWKCGRAQHFSLRDTLPACPRCGGNRWLVAQA